MRQLLTQTEIHVWLSSFQEQTGNVESLWVYLAENEMQRATQFYFERDRVRFIQGRYWLKTILSLYLQTNIQNITLSYNDSGKPFLDSNTSIYFNLSHAGDVLALAISRQSTLGIDVEMITSQDIGPLLTPDLFTPQELHVLTQLEGPNQQQLFYKMWVNKEAVLKAFGVGLHHPLNLINIEQTKHKNVWMARDLYKIHPPLFLFELRNISSQYVGAIAVPNSYFKIRYCNVLIN